MRAGTLRERVTFQTAGMVQNAIGEMVPGWTATYSNIPASVVDLNGREFLAASAVQNAVSTKIATRQTGLVASMRAVHGSDTYNIESVLKQRDKSFLLMCTRVG